MSADPGTEARPKPWYRESWPWFLLAGPALVVIAGLATAFIAFRGADGLVADDYYRRGLEINRQIARDEAARALGIAGELRVLPGHVLVRLRAAATLPDRLTLTLAHPGRAAEDRVLHLARTAEDTWEAPLRELPAGRWLAIIETGRWRVSAPIDTRATLAVTLDPGVR